MSWLLAIIQFDVVAQVMLVLTVILGGVVVHFSVNHFIGDPLKRQAISLMLLLILSLSLMVVSDHVALFLGCLLLSHLLMVRLMIHDHRWQQARAAGMLTARNFLMAWLAMAVGLWIICTQTDVRYFSQMNEASLSSSLFSQFGVLLIFLGVMIQSGLWPFHRWLLSSLNSPTPVSAMMHAGLINAGGLLLLRTHNLWIGSELILNGVLIVATVTIVLASIWKLMQSDVKRMLACSTSSQMAFMIVQCASGLFTMALSHIVLHSFFKACLFLSTGSVIQDIREGKAQVHSLKQFLCATVIAMLSVLIFIKITDQALFPVTSWLMIDILIGLMSCQMAVTLLNEISIRQVMSSTFIVTSLVAAYGFFVEMTEQILAPALVPEPLALSIGSIFVIAVITAMWCLSLWYTSAQHKVEKLERWHRWYVALLRSSQPHPSTMTTHRLNYTH